MPARVATRNLVEHDTGVVVPLLVDPIHLRGHTQHVTEAMDTHVHVSTCRSAYGARGVTRQAEPERLLDLENLAHGRLTNTASRNHLVCHTYIYLFMKACYALACGVLLPACCAKREGRVFSAPKRQAAVIMARSATELSECAVCMLSGPNAREEGQVEGMLSTRIKEMRFVQSVWPEQQQAVTSNVSRSDGFMYRLLEATGRFLLASQ